MSTNPFFHNNNRRVEQDLMERMATEAIRIKGIDMVYIPREVVNENKVFGDDPLSSFSEQYPIEVYIENVDGFEGAGDFLGRFGFELQDSATLVMSKRRFKEETGRDFPYEGDLIYFPWTKGLFEIKFVEKEDPFYQLGKNHVFKLSVQLFQYSEEDFDTGDRDIDRIVEDFAFKQYVTVGSTASGAFQEGQTVYSYLDGTTSGTSLSADSRGTLLDIDGSTLTIINALGPWTPSEATRERYIASETAWADIASVNDTVDQDPFDDNKDIEDDADSFIDFTESSPFGDY